MRFEQVMNLMTLVSMAHHGEAHMDVRNGVVSGWGWIDDPMLEDVARVMMSEGDADGRFGVLSTGNFGICADECADEDEMMDEEDFEDEYYLDGDRYFSNYGNHEVNDDHLAEFMRALLG